MEVDDDFYDFKKRERILICPNVCFLGGEVVHLRGEKIDLDDISYVINFFIEEIHYPSGEVIRLGKVK